MPCWSRRGLPAGRRSNPIPSRRASPPASHGGPHARRIAWPTRSQRARRRWRRSRSCCAAAAARDGRHRADPHPPNSPARLGARYPDTQGILALIPICDLMRFLICASSRNACCRRDECREGRTEQRGCCRVVGSPILCPSICGRKDSYCCRHTRSI
jgi:hypothetical protein